MLANLVNQILNAEVDKTHKEIREQRELCKCCMIRQRRRDINTNGLLLLCLECSKEKNKRTNEARRQRNLLNKQLKKRE